LSRRLRPNADSSLDERLNTFPECIMLHRQVQGILDDAKAEGAPDVFTSSEVARAAYIQILTSLPCPWTFPWKIAELRGRVARCGCVSIDQRATLLGVGVSCFVCMAVGNSIGG
jgi:hypothetical protein